MLSSDIKDVKMTQIKSSKVKNYKAKIKNILDGFTDRIGIIDAKISKLKDILVKLFKTKHIKRRQIINT